MGSKNKSDNNNNIQVADKEYYISNSQEQRQSTGTKHDESNKSDNRDREGTSNNNVLVEEEEVGSSHIDEENQSLGNKKDEVSKSDNSNREGTSNNIIPIAKKFLLPIHQG